MTHYELRDLVFRADSAKLRQYAQDLLVQNPERSNAADSLELIAFLVDSDFAGAEAKIETLKFKYANSEKYLEIKSTSNLVKAHIYFAYGRFNDLEEIVNSELSDFASGKSSLEASDVLQMLRILAQKQLILNQYSQLIELSQRADEFLNGGNHEQIYYIGNAIKAMTHAARGEHRSALELANFNLNIATQHKYVGIMAPLDSLYIKGISLLAMASPKEAMSIFNKLIMQSEEYAHWPWYFLAGGNISREYAINNKFAEALSVVRDQREQIAGFNFKNELSFIPDANELFIRYLIKDVERIETLINRMPEIALVKQIRALKDEWNGKDMLEWIKALPTDTPREEIYKLFALSDYYSDRESVAVDYMRQALVIVEETGSVEFLLRQHKLFDIILKAVSKDPTPFMEDIIRRITDRIRLNSENNQGDLPTPLTSRELEVIRYLSTGKPISNISNSLHISMNTMKTHLRNIYRKMDVDGRERAVERAKELFLI